MATTLQNIIAKLRAANILPSEKVNSGITDNLKPPYCSVSDYSHTLEYDTDGPVIKTAAFTITIIDKSQDEAETFASQFDDILNFKQDVTPKTMGCVQTGYSAGQMAENLYQFGTSISYELQEDLTRP